MTITAGLGLPTVVESARPVQAFKLGSITNPGDTVSRSGTVTFLGPLTNPKLTNYTPDTDVWVKYTGSLIAGQTLVLDVAEHTAIRQPDGASLIGSMSNAGAKQWMILDPGVNRVALTADAGTGIAQISMTATYH